MRQYAASILYDILSDQYNLSKSINLCKLINSIDRLEGAFCD